MSKWCEKENIRWYSVDTLEELLSYVANNGGN